MKPTIDDCLQLARTTLRVEDTPAIIYFDKHLASLAVEPCADFIRKALDLDRYVIVMRVASEDIVPVQRQTCAKCKVIDIHAQAVRTSSTSASLSD